MPPKPKFTREEVVQAGCEIVKRAGLDAVVAREVAKQLGATTGPIFTYFDTMEELKEEVYNLSMKHCMDYLTESLHYFPAFKEFGMRWVRFAKENPHLYTMLFLSRDSKQEGRGIFCPQFQEAIKPIESEVQETFRLSADRASDLVEHMLVYAQGVSCMIINGVEAYTEDEIGRRFSRICLSMVDVYRLEQGTQDPEQILYMLSAAGKLPRIKQ